MPPELEEELLVAVHILLRQTFPVVQSLFTQQFPTIHMPAQLTCPAPHPELLELDEELDAMPPEEDELELEEELDDEELEEELEDEELEDELVGEHMLLRQTFPEGQSALTQQLPVTHIPPQAN